jgi:hypothetical protein
MNKERITAKILFIIVFVITFISNACEDILKLNVIGDGNIIIDTLRLRSHFISEVELTDNFILEIYKSEIPALHVEADSNLMIYIKTDYARNKQTISRQSDYNLKPSRNIIVRLFINNLSLITVNNRGKVICDTLSTEPAIEPSKLSINIYGKSTFKSNYIKVDNFNCTTEGGSTININGEFNLINYSQTGSGETFLQGSSELINLQLEGSGKIEALNLASKIAKITLKNSGLIYCSVSDSLSVYLKGTGRVYYKGKPYTRENANIYIEGEGIVEEI